MFVSIGIGLANSDEAVADLAQALIGSINAANPGKVFLADITIVEAFLCPE